MTQRPSSFSEAFEILDQAIASANEPELKSLIAHESQASLEAVKREARELFSIFENDIRERPLLYLGAFAAGAVAVGLFARAATRTPDPLATKRRRQLERWENEAADDKAV